MSTLFVNNLNTASGSTITIPSGKTLKATDTPIVGAGNVIQVLQVENPTTVVGTNSTSFTATGHTISITPKYSSSKILVTLTGGQITYSSVDKLRVRFYRKIGTGGYSDITGDIERISLNSTYDFGHSASYLDSPSTTSTVIYQPYYRSANGNTVYYDYNQVDTNAMLTVMEIAQ